MSGIPHGLPHGWQSTTLREIAEIVGGVTKDAKKSSGAGFRDVPYLRVANVQRGRLDLTEVKLISASESDIQKLSLLPGDILLNEGGDRDKLGRGWIWQGQIPVCIHQNHVFRARLLSRDVDPVYIAHFTNSMAQSYFAEHGSQTTNLASISLTKLGSLPIRLPPAAEQTRIVAKLEELLSDLDAGVAELKAAQKKLRQYRQSLLKAAVEGALTATWREAQRKLSTATETGAQLLQRILTEHRARWEAKQLAKFKEQGKAPPKDWQKKYPEPVQSDTTDLPELPEGWVWACWSQIGFSQNGRPFPSADYREAGVRLLRPGNLLVDGSVGWPSKNTRFLDESHAAANEDLLVGAGELVMNLTAQSLKDDFLGRVCMTRTNERCLLNQPIARLTPVAMHVEFCHVVFMSPLFRRFVASLNTGSLIQHMFTSQVERFAFPVPPLEEQQRIAELVRLVLQSIEDQSRAIELSLYQSTAQRQNILRAAFAGQLVPQDPNDEPASVLLERIRAERDARSIQQKPRARTARAPA